MENEKIVENDLLIKKLVKEIAETGKTLGIEYEDLSKGDNPKRIKEAMEKKLRD